MSFVEHLDVLRVHLFKAFVAIAVGAVVAGIYNKFIIKAVLLGPTQSSFPTYGFVCRLGNWMRLGDALCMKGIALKMQSTNVSGQFSMWFTIVLMSGLILAFPYVFYQFWSFIKPGLKREELSQTRGVIFWVSFLFFTGVAFGYFVVTPYALNFFFNFQLDEIIENRWTINSYIDMILPIVLGSGLAFQMPLVIFFLAKIGLVTAKYLRSVRKYAVVIIFIVAGIITPGPDIISQLAVALPLLLLYEISIVLSKRVEKKEEEAEAKEWS